MDGTAVKELAERFRGPSLVEGFIAAPNGWNLLDPDSLLKPPTPTELGVYSLSAVRDYIKANRDAAILDKLTVHVVSPQIVTVNGPLFGITRHRETFVKATAQNLTDNFIGKSVAIEEFIVGLQTRFAHTDDRAAVLRLIGNVKHEKSATAADDGVTQTVTAKTGIVLAQDAAVPNPVSLTPFRTFREVTQPSSLFVLRVQGGGNLGHMTIGLHEADGGAWRLTAIERVRDWLRTELPPEVAVLA